MDNYIYLNSTATTKPTDAVLEQFEKINRFIWYNPSSTIHETGLAAKQLVESARERIGNIIGVKHDKIIFTSGSTESANTIIQGFIPRGSERNYAIICSPIEHPAVWETVMYMGRCGVDVSTLMCDRYGFVDLDHLNYLLDHYKYKDGTLVCVMGSNNEIGTIEPILEISDCVHKYSRAKFFCDMTQSFAHAPVYDARFLEFDYACGSAHKFGGLKGSGFIYAKDPSSILPLIYGGGQEHGMRSGTENVGGIATMASAFDESARNRGTTLTIVNALRERLVDGLQKIGGIVLSPTDGLATIVSVLFEGISANDVITMMDLKGYELSAGSACSTGKKTPSRTLKAIGLSDEEAYSVLRISLSPELRPDDIDKFLRQLEGVIH